MYDYVVIGSGFGGSVSALRLAEKGYSVLILEEGRRYADHDFPKTNNNPFRYFWMPRLGCRGFQRITFFKHAAVLGAAGVGGGSINYANTLLKPKDEFFESRDLPSSVSWKNELAPFFDLCAQMLRPVKCPALTGMDTVLKNAAEKAGVKQTWYMEDVAVHFGEPDVKAPDPYFGGKGPQRAGCNFCGGCMIGCRNGAKNSLMKNYLYFAEALGVEILPESKAVDIIPREDGYTIEYLRPGLISKGKRKRIEAKGVVFAGGVVGTVKLLFALQRAGRITVSEMLGHKVRTNSESLIAVRKHGKDVDYSEGVAITSGTYIDEKTHVEVVRYPKGANALSILTALLTDKRKGIWRPLSMLANVFRHPLGALKALNPAGWARETIILLVMQAEDNCIRLKAKRRIFGGLKVVSDIEEGSAVVPVYIPQAHEFARNIASDIGAAPLSNIYEVFFNASLTAHILGGCVMGEDASSGVIDSSHRLFGYEDLYVVDASVIPANLGVNPVMTIVAFAERAMSLIPDKRPYEKR